MAQDSEKRFHSIMDKLFQSPKHISNPNSSSPSGVEISRGKKRPNPSSALALVEPNTFLGLHNSSATAESSQPPLCRPWDRGDLLRRLATFKSMTWFAKPEVVSAVNCARRGWINVDIDTIACEACGARILFSTPSSWAKQQVEKAALVFSLKLDSGHKLLCPWIDNACAETLSQFPPTLPHILVDKFNERSSNLLQVLALPLISSSAIEYMKSPQLEEFLKESPASQCENGSSDVSLTEYLGNGCDANSPSLYYQAQKLISLCGWEPRLLSYIVDSKGESNQIVKDGTISHSSHIVAYKPDSSIGMHSVGAEGSVDTNDLTRVSGGLECDPKSIVLDCKLCGASVGLWVFLTVPRPIELFRVVGYSEVNGENIFGTYDLGNENHEDNRNIVNSVYRETTSKDRMSNLNLTIAGGPPPTKQNFKATISLPIIGQNLRARFSYDSQFRDCMHVRHDSITSASDAKNFLDERYLAENTLSGELNHSREISDKRPHDAVMENPIESTHNDVEDINYTDTLTGNTVKSGLVSADGADFSSSQVMDASAVTTDATLVIKDGEMITSSDNSSVQHIPVNETSGRKENFTASNPGSSNVDNLCKLDTREGETTSDVQTTSDAEANSGKGTRVKERLPIPVRSTDVALSTGNTSKQLPLDKPMEFDPIRQHRHFCPWIASTGSGAPGWKQTLYALQRKPNSHSSPTNSHSPSMIMVDDPITSIRKLFMSPSPKRMKPTHGSS